MSSERAQIAVRLDVGGPAWGALDPQASHMLAGLIIESLRACQSPCVQEGTEWPPGGSSTHVWLLQEVVYFQDMTKGVAILLMFLN